MPTVWLRMSRSRRTPARHATRLTVRAALSPDPGSIRERALPPAAAAIRPTISLLTRCTVPSRNAATFSMLFPAFHMVPEVAILGQAELVPLLADAIRSSHHPVAEFIALSNSLNTDNVPNSARHDGVEVSSAC